jgi:hypothetical protein
MSCLIQGGSTGADALAKAWAIKNGVPMFECPANWSYYGTSAGPVRNAWMVDYFPTTLVVAFPGGSGTASMVKIARALRIEVKEVP